MNEANVSSLEELENNIIEQCIDPEGFLSLLHENRFDQVKYQVLLSLLTEYRQAVNHTKYVRRKVAGCLRYLEMGLGNTAAFYNRKEGIPTSETGRSVINAHARIWDMIDEIYQWDDKD